ncbi:hypothetical protein NDU88_007929 [Pleurodeles waltl]|uniref:Uncharacterized protein n=1 Tax=Pleurodeles waltl TaxID=8319 RepID=A0AAV7N525_PLEWA|nr:hypothetical protein NDU88_007929 [Pleurodeles waltl]
MRAPPRKTAAALPPAGFASRALYASSRLTKERWERRNQSSGTTKISAYATAAAGFLFLPPGAREAQEVQETLHKQKEHSAHQIRLQLQQQRMEIPNRCH